MIDGNRIDARAKLNLFLEVLRRRDDGFHDLESIFLEIDLADELTAESAPESTLELTNSGIPVPVDETNLILRAARLLQERTTVSAGARIHIHKRIPLGAGLGGGSSDAAAALQLLDRVWGLDLGAKELAGFAALLGSDVPFFLTGGTCLCQGRGERVVPLDVTPELEFVLVLPPWGISTPAAYGALAGSELGTVDVSPFLSALRSGDADGIGKHSFNRFEQVVHKVEPRQGDLLEELRRRDDLVARMSGSGSSVWCLPVGGKRSEDLVRELDSIRVDRLFGSMIVPVCGAANHGG